LFFLNRIFIFNELTGNKWSTDRMSLAGIIYTGTYGINLCVRRPSERYHFVYIRLACTPAAWRRLANVVKYVLPDQATARPYEQLTSQTVLMVGGCFYRC